MWEIVSVLQCLLRSSFLSIEGVWGSYKTRAVLEESASGYMDSPHALLRPVKFMGLNVPKLNI